MRYTHFVRARLDRSLGNNAWFETFPSGRSEYLRFEGSDHRPIVTFIDDTKIKRRGIFRFDNRLRENEEVSALIHQVWNQNKDASLEEKISLCRRAIIKWSKDQNLNSAKVISASQQALEEALSADIPDPTIIGRHTAILEKAYLDEEKFWKQRSRVMWLHNGDRNSSYFHATTRTRRAINRFTVLESETGTVVFEEPQIVKVITEFYQNLFTTNQNSDFRIVEEALEPKITEEQNAHLTRPPTGEEIKAAAFTIHPGKAPGPDGFSAGFFRSYWATVGEDIISVVKQIFVTKTFPNNFNATHVRLIPKGLGPRKITDYRPIALCNVSYKIVAKILTKRLQPLLNGIISENQSAFVPGRAISDNVLITHETLHYLKNSSALKK